MSVRRLGYFSMVLCTAAIPFGVSTAAADPVADFYKGKTITVVVPAGMGGSIGLYGRLFADHFGKNLPGKPNVIAQAHPGGSGVKAASFVYNVAPRDGTIVAELLSNSLLAPLLRNAKFDPTKFTWLGTISPRASVIGVWHTAPATTLAGVKKAEVVLASGGRSAANNIVPLLMNKALGTRFKIVNGYRGGGTMNKAMEAGEVNGRYLFWTGWVTRKPHWIKNGKVKVLVQVGPPIPELPDVPSLLSLVKDKEYRRMLTFMATSERVGLAYWIHRDVPAARAAALRAAFDATMKDPAFIADAKKRNAPIDPRPAEYVEATVKDGYNISRETVARLKAIVGLGKPKKK